MSAIENDVAQLLLQQGAKAPEVIQCGEFGERVVVVPTAMQVQSLKHFFPPQRVEQRVTLLEAGSFIEYVNRFKTAATLIFADITEAGVTFMAVLDYHRPAKDAGPSPDYCKHLAYFAAMETPEWKVWRQFNRLAMKQVDFASFLEDNAQLFLTPSGAELLELVRTLHGHSNARFTTALRLDNGAYSVSYDEDVVIKGGASSRAGAIELPASVKAGVPVFLGAEPRIIHARLKTRVTERQLILFYETIQLQAVVRDGVMQLVKQVAEKTGIVPLLGRA